MAGGTITLDAQLGHPVPQKVLRGGTLTVEGAATVKP